MTPKSSNKGSSAVGESESTLEAEQTMEEKSLSKNGAGKQNGRTVLATCLKTPERKFQVSREELVRVMTQSLRDLGYAETASQLEQESGVLQQAPGVNVLTQHIEAGRWDEALQTLDDLLLVPHDENNGKGCIANDRGLKPRPKSEFNVKREHESLQACKQLVYRSKYYECLQGDDTTRTLECLRALTSHICSSRCRNPHRLVQTLAEHLLPGQQTPASTTPRALFRASVVEDIHRLLPKSVAVPPQRLLSLLEHSIVEQARAADLAPSRVRSQPASLLKDLQQDVKQDHKQNLNDHASRDAAPSPVPPRHMVQVLRDESSHAQVWNCKFTHKGDFVAATVASTVLLYRVDYSCLAQNDGLEKEGERAAGSDNGKDTHGPLVYFTKFDCATASSSSSTTTTVAGSSTTNSAVSSSATAAFGTSAPVPPPSAASEAQHIFCLDWNPDDSRLVCGNGQGKLFLWNLLDDKQPPRQKQAHSDRVSAICWKDPKHFISASLDGSIHVYDVDFRCLEEFNPSSPVYSVFYCSRLEKLVAACNGPRYLRAFDIVPRKRSTGGVKFREDKFWPFEPDHTDHGFVKCAHYDASNGSFLVQYKECGASMNEYSRVGDRLKPQCTYEGVSSDRAILQPSFSKFGAMIARGTLGGSILVWNRHSVVFPETDVALLNESAEAPPQERSERYPCQFLYGHTQPVNCVAFSPVKSSLLVSASDDGTLRVWSSDALS